MVFIYSVVLFLFNVPASILVEEKSVEVISETDTVESDEGPATALQSPSSETEDSSSIGKKKYRPPPIHIHNSNFSDAPPQDEVKFLKL